MYVMNESQGRRSVLKDCCAIADNTVLPPETVVPPFTIFSGSPGNCFGGVWLYFNTFSLTSINVGLPGYHHFSDGLVGGLRLYRKNQCEKWDAWHMISRETICKPLQHFPPNFPLLSQKETNKNCQY